VVNEQMPYARNVSTVLRNYAFIEQMREALELVRRGARNRATLGSFLAPLSFSKKVLVWS